jgi:EmrB/QacA subfamily drug resistance transporter
MATTSATSSGTVAGAARRGHHPGAALAIIAASQLMVVLDATIVNIALPHIQSALKFSDTNLTWVLNAYTLTFGGLLLLGGRAGDILGRRRVFMFGIALFTFSSLLGGFATSAAWLLSARALQGIGGAIASPTALSLITTNFEEGAERNRAFGVFAAVSGAGAAVGLLAGGMLTSWLSWRWVFFVNIPIGIFIVFIAPLFINESEKTPGKFDVSGAIASTLGMSTLVYGFIRAASDGWGNTWTVVSFVAAAAFLISFFTIEVRSPQPITPLHLFKNRNRTASYVVMFALAAALYSMFFFLTLFVQDILGYSALKAGFAFLPVSACIVVSAQLASVFLIKVGPRPLMVLGAVLATGGMFWLSQISVHSGYVGGLLFPMVVFSLGMGFLFVPLTVVAVSGVEAHESGSASGLLNVMQQVGGTVGLAILTTAFATAQRHQSLHTPHQTKVILAHGISTALQVSVLFAAIALIGSIVGITAKASEIDASALPASA